MTVSHILDDNSLHGGKSINLKLWLILISAGLVILNTVLFVAYQQAHSGEHFWNQLWNYFESGTFQLLTASLALPIILLLLENHFNFVKGLVESRQEREKREIEERNERRKKIEQERKEKRLQAIEKTTDVLRHINSSVSKVRVFESNNPQGNSGASNDTRSNINDILMEIASLSISVSEVINVWTFQFPVLPRSTYTLFADYIRLLYWSAWAVAHCIQNKLVIDINHLQEHLAMIQRGVVSVGFHPMFNSLNFAMSLLESIEELSRELTQDKKYQATSKQDEIQRIIIDKIRFKLNNYIKENFRKEEPKGEIVKLIELQANKANNYIPAIPITAIWVECELKRRDIPPEISQSIFDEIKEISPDIKKKIEEVEKKMEEKKKIEKIQSIFDEIKEISPDIKKKIEEVEKKIEEVEDSEIERKNEDISHHTVEKMKEEIEGLVSNLLKLKVYQILLGIERFSKEEILPPIQPCSESIDVVNLRAHYQDLQKYLEDNPHLLKTESTKFKELFNSEKYLKFKDSYYNVTDLDLINIIAIDTIKRIKEIGRLMRFSSVIPLEEEDIAGTR
jgi:hypothetical protein